MRSRNRLLVLTAVVLWLALLASLLVLPAPLLAQETQEPPALAPAPLRFEHLNIENGLSQNAILAMIQDRQGFLWFGTQDGLNRYDGYDFTVYKNDPDDITTLSYSSILSIFEDPDGTLWVGTWGGGLNHFDPRTGQAIRFNHEPSNPDSLSNDLVAKVLRDSRGRLWIGTIGGGLDRYDEETGKFVHYRHDPNDPTSISSDNVGAIVEDASGVLWIGTGGFSTEGAGLDRLDPETGRFTHFAHDPDNRDSLSGNNITSILPMPDGILWVGTGGFGGEGEGLNRLDPLTGRAVRFKHREDDPASLSNDNVLSLVRDSSGRIWAGTWGGGLEQVVEQDGQVRFLHARNNPYDADSLSADIVWPILEDRSGVLWLGTVNGGISKVNPQVQSFRHYHNDPGNLDSMGFNVIGGFYEDSQGGIWIGTWGGGLDYFDRATGVFTHYRHDPANPTSLVDDTVSTIYEDPSGAIWVGTFNGLDRLDRATGQFNHFKHDPNERSTIINNGIYRIVPEGDGRLWLATLQGLDLFDPKTSLAVHFTANPKDHNALPDNRITELYRDSDGVLWVGTWQGGLSYLDPLAWKQGNTRFITYQTNPNYATTASDYAVWSLYEDDRGVLWVGTQAGLRRMDKRTGMFTRWSEKDGLPNNSVLCIRGDNQGHVWLSTNNGLSRFDLRNESFENFDVRDGLQSNEFDGGACMKTRSGELLFGGVHGFNLFVPEEIRDNPVPPPVVITGLNVRNEPVSVDLSGEVPIELSYREDFIGLDFTALDYHAPEKNQYAYKLEGLDPDWVEAGNRRYANYTKLAPGKYEFRVKAANSDGIWNEDFASIPITVRPPFWRTWWFQGLALLALGTVLAGGYWQRVRSLNNRQRDLEREVTRATSELRREIEQRRQAEEALAHKAAEEAVVAERTRLARELHDAVTQTLFSASMIADVLPEVWNMDPAEGRKSLDELRQLTRSALAEMRTLLLELRPSALNDARLEDLLRQLVTATSGRARLPINLTVDGQRALPLEVKLALYRIAQESLNNITKYARARQVTMDLRMQPKGVRLTVGDDGIGFDPEAVGSTHMGLRIMRERAEAVGARFSIYSEVGEGTVVTVAWSEPETTAPGDGS